MKHNTFEEFFIQATKRHDKEGNKPYAYQAKLAEADTWPMILKIPTGCGKTEAAILSWIWQRVIKEKDIPRRLIYCLPMRTLVEQTTERVIGWLKNLKMENEINIVMLMGDNVGRIKLDEGNVIDADKDWIEEPEKNTIIIGTQDMLLSRALNRGYGITPFRWPIEFGLVNNDCMWIIDEVQLMKNGLATTLQLEAFRQKNETIGASNTMWMSATIDSSNMTTVDFKAHDDFNESILDIQKITNARKPLQKLKIKPVKDKYEEKDVEAILEMYRKKPMLIIVNNVQRAQNLFAQIKSKVHHDVILVHSRFRSHERSEINNKISNIKKDDDVIIVSTQAIEAGVDISSHTLITEIAPITSMIQRFGRCNRKGEYVDAKVCWIELDFEKESPPYEKEELRLSSEWIKKHQSVSSSEIKDVKNTSIYDTVLRKSDLQGLFDTSPDISGRYLDVSRFVRDSDESSDVNVYWRELKNSFPNKSMVKHCNAEVCSVSIARFKEFVKQTKGDIGIWHYDYRKEDFFDNAWDKCDLNEIRPGQTFLVDSHSGGYSSDLGWDEKSNEPVKVIPYSKQNNKNNVNDKEWKDDYKLDKHSERTRNKMKEMLNSINNIDKTTGGILERAALFHDIGKGHKIFQDTINRQNPPLSNIWAKSPKYHYDKYKKEDIRHERKGFRHEVASALVYLENNQSSESTDLIAFLIAAHHGKVRLSLRTWRNDKDKDDRYLLGFTVEEPDTLPAMKIGNESIPETKIDMSISGIGIRDGKESWISKTSKLVNKYGPFKLAYMEAILRIVDTNASKEIQS